MEKPTQDDINNYILGPLYMPLKDRRHLEAMVILHFDVPDKMAREMVGKALARALEFYHRQETGLRNEVQSTQHMIAKLENWIPELNSEVKRRSE